MPTKTYGIVQKDNDQLGTDIYRSKDNTIPMAYRPTLVHTSRASANGNNLNHTVEAQVPLVRLVDGLAVSTDSFKATFKFSALQHVVNDDERAEAFDALIAYVKAKKADIIQGRKPLSSSDFVFGGP
mgnify:CR=1 FL=1